MSALKYKFETQTIHAGQTPDPSTLSRAVPVHRTSAYLFKDTEHAANLFALKEPGNIYTRIGNPTQAILEQRIAALEGGAAAVAFASGTSAIFNTIINIASQGEEIVSASNLYGGTFTMFSNILPQFGIKTRFAQLDDLGTFEKNITNKTRAIYIETIGNPVLQVADIEAISKVAKKYTLPLIVDSTFTTPYLLRPIEWGADIVVHSLTKWIGGHGTGIGGLVIDAGTFDWTDKKFKLYNEPDNSYHGIRYAHDLTELNAVAFAVRLRIVPLRNLGACISPDNAWLFLQGTETLHLRMERHASNALAVAEYLKDNPLVEWIRYPGLTGDPSYSLAQKYLNRGSGGMVVFGAKGGFKTAEKFINSLKLISHLANAGDAKSLAVHPASTSHSQLSEEEQRTGGLTPELIRLSIGIEHADDIIADIEQALKSSN